MNTPYHFARHELGVAEILGPNSNARINEYLASVGQPGDDSIPWCSAFVNWCFDQAKIQGSGKANARSWLDWPGGTPTNKPVPGDLAVFWRSTPAGKKGHVGFYVDETPSHILVLGGNQRNRVCLAKYPKKRLITCIAYAH